MLTMWFILGVAQSFSLTRSAARQRTTTLCMSTLFPKVVVQRNRQSKSFREGNPLVFTKTIAYTQSEHYEKSLPMACFVQVEVPMEKTSNNTKKKKNYPHYHQDDAPLQPKTQVIGWGVYNPSSMYRVRILCHSLTMSPKVKQQLESNALNQHDALALIVKSQMQAAIQVRKVLGLFENNNNSSPLYTDTFRLINGEGDGLSGLAVDVIGNKVAVCMSSAAWSQIHKDLILECLKGVLVDYDYDVVWKTTPARLKQDGMEIEENNEENNDDDTIVVATELGIKYTTFLYAQGQKTGYYCDQRENRWTLAQYCSNARVLDLCCYHGGFALNAVLHGQASHVTGVDSSQQAIDVCHMNAELNNVGSDMIDFVKDDISKFMKQAEARGDSYDVICLDPPKLAPSASGLDRAKRKYHGLNRDALKLINPDNGGLLMTCTCSAAMTQKDGGQYFLSMVQQAAIAARRRITLLRVTGAAPCHTQSPASYPAGAYLTAALFYVSPTK